ncbi:MAG: hypothetical protein JXA18_13015 [Chitinispirillaceae bacterium]|nr:hypothetical protein [Chitinispirillaceae bacterium]
MNILTNVLHFAGDVDVLAKIARTAKDPLRVSIKIAHGHTLHYILMRYFTQRFSALTAVSQQWRRQWLRYGESPRRG